MTFVSLSTRLADLRAESSVELAAIDQVLSDLHTSQTHARAEIQRLQQQLRELNEQALAQEHRREDCLVVHLRNELAATFAALEASYADIAQTGLYWQTLIDIHQRRAEVLEHNPDLLINLEAYRAFECADPAMLQALPAYHRDLAIEGQRQLRERLIPYLELEEREQSLECGWNVALQITVVHDRAASEIHWILPFPAQLESLPDATSNALQIVASHVLTALSKIQQHANWYIAELSTSAWANYTVLHALAEQNSEQNLVESTQLLVQEQLSTIPIFERVVIDVHVTEVSVDVWERGLREDMVGRAPDSHPAAIISPEREEISAADITSPELNHEKTVQEQSESLPNKSNGWYSNADIISWERPVKAAEGSRWNIEARRLRTILMRLVAHGMIGDQAVDAVQLWGSLPTPHNEAVQGGITRMLEAGVLMESTNEMTMERAVTINPAMLAEVQTLINRDVAGVWTKLIAN
jgi:hypothetical protein